MQPSYYMLSPTIHAKIPQIPKFGVFLMNLGPSNSGHAPKFLGTFHTQLGPKTSIWSENFLSGSLLALKTNCSLEFNLDDLTRRSGLEQVEKSSFFSLFLTILESGGLRSATLSPFGLKFYLRTLREVIYLRHCVNLI